MTTRVTQYATKTSKVRPLGSSRDVVSHINAQKRAENLFIAAEKLGLDAPTESMLHEEFNHIICETVTDVCMWLDRNGLENVSRALVDAARRQELENAIG